jgi:hypothetical protein
LVDQITQPKGININLIYLIPLIIIFPIWLIFFDKATTISRIVGYYNILEQILNGVHPETKYIGWENSLQTLRGFKRNQEKCIKKIHGKILLWDDLSFEKKLFYFMRTMFIPRPSINQYRRIVYMGFFIISLMCIIFCIVTPIVYGFSYLFSLITTQFIVTIIFFFMIAVGVALTLALVYHKKRYLRRLCYALLGGIATLLLSFFIFYRVEIFSWVMKHLFSLTLFTIAFILFLIITSYNLKIVYQLSRGFHTYRANQELWNQILIVGIQPNDNIFSKPECAFREHWIELYFPP